MFITKPPRRGYMLRDWITVLISRMGRGLCSISCCITTARTSDVYTFFSPKHRLVAADTDTQITLSSTQKYSNRKISLVTMCNSVSEKTKLNGCQVEDNLPFMMDFMSHFVESTLCKEIRSSPGVRGDIEELPSPSNER
jgi:hypothetical protein